IEDVLAAHRAGPISPQRSSAWAIVPRLDRRLETREIRVLKRRAAELFAVTFVTRSAKASSRRSSASSWTGIASGRRGRPGSRCRSRVARTTENLMAIAFKLDSTTSEGTFIRVLRDGQPFGKILDDAMG